MKELSSKFIKEKWNNCTVTFECKTFDHGGWSKQAVRIEPDDGYYIWVVTAHLPCSRSPVKYYALGKGKKEVIDYMIRLFDYLNAKRSLFEIEAADDVTTEKVLSDPKVVMNC